MKLNVVLVRTIYGGNVGSVTRVIANMGADRLILIDPQCEINSQAFKNAAGAQKLLSTIVTYKNWDEFYKKEDRGIRIAFCCREGRDRALKNYSDHLEFFKERNDEEPVKDVYFIFGPEDNGLSTPEMERTHMRARLPTYGQFQSMNLSHAVLLALHMFQESRQAKTRKRQKTFKLSGSKRLAKHPEQQLREWLMAMGFDPDERQGSAIKTLNRMLLMNVPTEYDLSIFDSVIRQCIRKLKGAPSPDLEN